MSDQVEDAVKAANGQQPELVQVGPVAIASTGRPFVIAVPRDITDAELLEVASWITSPVGLRALLRRPTAASRILIPAH